MDKSEAGHHMTFAHRFHAMASSWHELGFLGRTYRHQHQSFFLLAQIYCWLVYLYSGLFCSMEYDKIHAGNANSPLPSFHSPTERHHGILVCSLIISSKQINFQIPLRYVESFLKCLQCLSVPLSERANFLWLLLNSSNSHCCRRTTNQF